MQNSRWPRCWGLSPAKLKTPAGCPLIQFRSAPSTWRQCQGPESEGWIPRWPFCQVPFAGNSSRLSPVLLMDREHIRVAIIPSSGSLATAAYRDQENTYLHPTSTHLLWRIFRKIKWAARWKRGKDRGVWQGVSLHVLSRNLHLGSYWKPRPACFYTGMTDQITEHQETT
jgi:hypothetical protein